MYPGSGRNDFAGLLAISARIQVTGLGTPSFSIMTADLYRATAARATAEGMPPSDLVRLATSAPERDLLPAPLPRIWRQAITQAVCEGT